jgi:hypothetical protein
MRGAFTRCSNDRSSCKYVGLIRVHVVCVTIEYELVTNYLAPLSETARSGGAKQIIRYSKYHVEPFMRIAGYKDARTRIVRTIPKVHRLRHRNFFSLFRSLPESSSFACFVCLHEKDCNGHVHIKTKTYHRLALYCITSLHLQYFLQLYRKDKSRLSTVDHNC